jgi:hypothetical protein
MGDMEGITTSQISLVALLMASQLSTSAAPDVVSLWGGARDDHSETPSPCPRRITVAFIG